VGDAGVGGRGGEEAQLTGSPRPHRAGSQGEGETPACEAARPSENPSAVRGSRQWGKVALQKITET
jgi:hypothetical protein